MKPEAGRNSRKEGQKARSVRRAWVVHALAGNLALPSGAVPVFWRTVHLPEAKTACRRTEALSRGSRFGSLFALLLLVVVVVRQFLLIG
jgi:hypothetical protein